MQTRVLEVTFFPEFPERKEAIIKFVMDASGMVEKEARNLVESNWKDAWFSFEVPVEMSMERLKNLPKDGAGGMDMAWL